MEFKKIFFAVIFIGLIARIFSLIVLPESAYTDSLFHLLLVKDIIAQQTLFLSEWLIPPPLFHLFTANAFILSGLPVNAVFSKLFPLLFMLVLLLFSFLLLRKLYQNNYFIGFSLIAVFPWLIRYGSVNYVEQLSAILLLFSLYLLLSFEKSGNKNLVWALIPAISVFPLSKYAAAIFSPIFFIAILYLLVKKNFSKKFIAFFVIASLFLSGFWFAVNLSTYGSVFGNEAAAGISEAVSGKEIQTFAPFESYLSFFDFPPIESFQRIPLLQSIPIFTFAIIFSVIVLPIFLILLFGFYKFITEKNLFNAVLIAVLVFSFIFTLYFTLIDARVNGVLYVRLWIPTMPLLGLLFARGFLSISKKWIKKTVLISLILFSIYSLAFTSVSALFYNSNYEKHEGLFEFAKTLPENAKIFSDENGRAIAFFAGKEFGSIDDIYELDSVEIFAKLKEAGFTQVALGCYRNLWSEEKLNELVSNGYFTEIYADSCTKMYKIN